MTLKSAWTLSALARTAAVGLCIAATAPMTAQAKTPKEVVTAYKAYAAAEAKGDYEGAKELALQAWEVAEDQMGDSKLTGDLAFNYARQVRTGVDKPQAKAAERAMKLAHYYEDDAAAVHLERGVTHLTVLNGLGKEGTLIRNAKDLVEFGDENGLSDSTFQAEALTLLAGAYASKKYNKDAKEAADRALEIFDAATDGIQSAYSLQANLYSGYVYEYEEEHLDAALHYQKVMEMTDGLDPEVYPVVGTALGRWIHMRSALSSADKLDEAEQAGICKCWPYDKDRNEDVKPIKRTPPTMPKEAQQSGYVVVEFDLNDDGSVTNARAVTAWPDYFEEPALDSIDAWEYAPRTEEQIDEDRKDLITTIKFRLTDEDGDVIW